MRYKVVTESSVKLLAVEGDLPPELDAMRQRMEISFNAQLSSLVASWEASVNELLEAMAAQARELEGRRIV